MDVKVYPDYSFLMLWQFGMYTTMAFSKYFVLQTKDIYERCKVLEGTWRPPPIPRDIHSDLAYPSADGTWGWMILSAKNTGSQLHFDPELMGAWNLLVSGELYICRYGCFIFILYHQRQIQINPKWFTLKKLVIGLPGAISVQAIIFYLFLLEIIIRSFQKNLTKCKKYFSAKKIIFYCKKGPKSPIFH